MPAEDAISDLRRDFSRMSATFRPSGVGVWRRVLFALGNSELHCVAAYRFGRYARGCRRRGELVWIPLTILHRIWNRWITHMHHCDISTRAMIGPGMLLMHRTGVIIGPAQIGDDVVLHQNVTIGQRVAGGNQGVPHIGAGVWIGPNAVLSGPISVGDRATVSAGSVLLRDAPARALVGGVPARVLMMEYDNSAMTGVTT